MLERGPAHPARNPRSPRFLTTVGFLVAAVLIAAVGAIAYRSNVDLVEAFAQREHAGRVVADLTALRAALEEAEARQRRFLLTDDAAELARLEGAAVNVRRVLSSLDTVIRVPAARADLPRLDSLTLLRLDLLAQTAAAHRIDPAASQARLRTGRGNLVMAEFRELVVRMSQQERTLVAEREALVEREAARSRATLMAATVAAIVVLSVVLYLLYRQIVVRQQAELELAGLNAELRRQNDSLVEAREAMQKQTALLSSVLESIGEGVAVVDTKGRLTHMNPAARSILGMHASEPLPESIADRVDILDPATMEVWPRDRLPTRSAARGVETDDLSLVVRRRDSEPLWISATSRPVRGPEGVIAGGVVVYRDATAERAVVEDQRRARVAAEEASHAKGRFLANMSHELRTPLNGVIGMLDLAADTDDEALRTRYMATATRAAETLLDIINDVLDLSRIEAGRMSVEAIPLRVRSAVQDVVESFVPISQRKGVELVASVDPRVPDDLIGDPVRLRQVLRNLVSNAVKFTDEGTVAVQVERIGEAGDVVELALRVADTGIGIPPSKLDLIFEAFTQADDSTTRTHGGTGLGLRIAADLVALMGGRMHVRSEPGAGSTFEAILPLRKAAAAGAAADVPDATDLRSLRVLVVDDNEHTRRALCETLASWRMPTDAVGGAEAAWTAFEEAGRTGAPHRLVLIDRDLPDTDAFTLARRIRAAGDPGPVILLLAPTGRADDATRCRELGIAQRLLKPVRPSELLDAILEAVRGAAAPGPVPKVRAADRAERPPLRVLVAEDHEFNEMVARAHLERCGHDVTSVRNGAEAVAAALGDPGFDVILMDVQMPEMDGLEATRRIRAGEPTGRHTPIVAMTAHALDGDREACLQAGMDDYLPKPLRSADLLALLQRVLPDDARAGTAAPAASHDGATAFLRIDPAALLAEAGGDAVLLHRLRDRFREQCGTLRHDLRNALARGDAAALRESAHALTGAIGFWHQGPAFDRARGIERAAATGRTDLAADVAALEKDLEPLLEEIERL